MPEKGNKSTSSGDERLLDVSTERATYWLHPGSHQRQTRISDGTMQKIDGIVLESGMDSYKDLCLDDLRKNPQYGDIISRTIEHKKNISFVDVPYAHSDTRVFLGEGGAKLGIPFLAGLLGMVHAHPGFGLLTIPALAFCAGGSNHSNIPNRIASYAQLSNAYNSFGFRSAVAAEKLEKVIAPRLQEDCDHPTVFVDYGAGHLDIATYLKHPVVRQSVIRFGKHTLRSTLDMDHLQKVCEYEFNASTNQYEKRIHEQRF